jgi:hypothetical protein
MKCKKSLYKSTYKGHAFTKGKEYVIDSEDAEFYTFIDNLGRKFEMSKKLTTIYYFVEDYFEMGR